MADTAVVVNISDMIDLAIGTPEVGVVDFNMLQTVLHCLAQQLRILGKNVELRGSLTALSVARDNVQTIAISEFMVDTGEPQPKDSSKVIPPDESILVVERVKKSETGKASPGRGISPLPRGGTTPTSTAGQAGAGGAAGGTGAQGAVGAAGTPGAAGAPGEKLSVVTMSKFNLLENTVNDIAKRVYGSMPKNEEILEEVRSQTNIKAIQDMWTNLNVSSRLEAAENGINKLSSLVQDLIGESAELNRRASQMTTKSTKSGGYEPAAGAAAVSAGVGGAGGGQGGTVGGQEGAEGGHDGGAGGTVYQPTIIQQTLMAPPGDPSVAPTHDDIAAIYGQLNRMQGEITGVNNNLQAFVNEMMGDYQDGDYQGQDVSTDGGVKMTDQGGTPASGRTTPGGGPFRGPGGGPAGGAAGSGPGGKRPMSAGGAGPGGINNRISDLEKQMHDCCDNNNKNFSTLLDHISSVEDQVEQLMKQICEAGVNIDADSIRASGGGGGGGKSGLAGAGGAQMSPDLAKDIQGLMQLFSTVQEMQGQLAEVHNTALQLAGEKEDRQHHINALLEQIELLKVVKMDREDMAQAMAEKADLRALARKVSHDQFEMACDDLAKGLENAIGKLNMQESLWQQALDDIQREIETKLDKMELSPVKDFFNNKLKQLQENLKQMALLRREVEAAGTKRKLLRDVNCISCDANAVMNMEPAVALPASKPLPPTISMKPYLSYELDAIRKAQATNMPQRNMHDWETIDKQMAHAKAPHKVRSETDKHLCNRYCGGSHTVTTPAQRVARLGHFIKQWGPDVVPLSSGLAAGDDGKMYKVTNLETANVGPGGAVDTICTPKSKKTDALKSSSKTLVISAECRCLEDQSPGRQKK